MRIVFAAIAIAFCHATTAQQILVYGIGSDSCGSYVLALSEHRPTAAIVMQGKTYYTTANAYTQWLSGFVTATNNAADDAKRQQIAVDIAGMSVWIRNYCNANPTQSVLKAALEFVDAHQRK
jgi:hypothetical protein